MTLIAQHDKEETVKNVKIIPLVKPGNRFQRMTKNAWHIYRKAVATNADIYHFHDPELITVGIMLKLFGKKVIYDVHEDYSEAILYKEWIPLNMRKIIAFFSNSFEKSLARFFDGIVVVTNLIGSRFISAKTKNVIEVKNFPLSHQIAAQEFSVPWKDRENIVVFIGSISKVRGIKEMISAMNLLPKERNIKLILAGNFTSVSLAEEIRCEPGWDRCEHVGYVHFKDSLKFFGQARMGFVLTHPVANLRNGLPVKLFEYMNAGIPVIASDFPLWREIIEKAGCGICVNPLNPEAIAEAIIHLIEHPAESEAMGMRGRKAVEEIYNWDMEEKKLLNFYNTLSVNSENY